MDRDHLLELARSAMAALLSVATWSSAGMWIEIDVLAAEVRLGDRAHGVPVGGVAREGTGTLATAAISSVSSDSASIV